MLTGPSLSANCNEVNKSLKHQRTKSLIKDREQWCIGEYRGVEKAAVLVGSRKPYRLIKSTSLRKLLWVRWSRSAAAFSGALRWTFTYCSMNLIFVFLFFGYFLHSWRAVCFCSIKLVQSQTSFILENSWAKKIRMSGEVLSRMQKDWLPVIDLRRRCDTWLSVKSIIRPAIRFKNKAVKNNIFKPKPEDFDMRLVFIKVRLKLALLLAEIVTWS